MNRIFDKLKPSDQDLKKREKFREEFQEIIQQRWKGEF